LTFVEPLIASHIYLVEYAYESGRISGLNWQVGTHTGSAGYTYQNGLIHQLQYQNGPTVTHTYDPVERYKTRVKNENASGGISGIRRRMQISDGFRFVSRQNSWRMPRLPIFRLMRHGRKRVEYGCRDRW
jgi:hypothetical protein